MQRVRIKYCGLTHPADALAAVAAGVDAVGFVFARESPRYVTPEQAREIGDRLPAFVNKVGLFVDADAAEIDGVRTVSGIDTVQLHGQESPELCAAVDCAVIKVLRVGEAADLNAELARFPMVNAVLFDTYDARVAGGTGRTFDWSVLTRLEPPVPPLILAGGLTADNVGEAITRVRPFGVDVSGGIESEKGRKDPSKMMMFAKVVTDVCNAT